MKGAREYRKYLKRGKTEHESLIIEFGQHARGDTLHISIKTTEGILEVYGVVGGQPGWTESYGWLHKGPWVGDFENYIESRRLEVEASELRNQAVSKEHAKARKESEARILAAYKQEHEE